MTNIVVENLLSNTEHVFLLVPFYILKEKKKVHYLAFISLAWNTLCNYQK